MIESTKMCINMYKSTIKNTNKICIVASLYFIFILVGPTITETTVKCLLSQYVDRGKCVAAITQISMLERLPLHCVLVAAIIVEALKWKKLLLAQLSTKLNKFCIKFWEYLDTKSIVIHMNICSSKNEEIAIFFQETV